MNSNNNNSVCVVGLGYVGLTLSTVMSNKGFKIFGVEKNLDIIKNLKKKNLIFMNLDLIHISKKI